MEYHKEKGKVVTDPSQGEEKVARLSSELLALFEGEERSVIEKAIDLGKRAHEGQFRKSGDPYIVHPLTVAKILREKMHMDTTGVAAAVLHDVVEDTPVTTEELEEEFGKEVAFLVDGVSKIGRVEVKSRLQQQAETVRKMILAMSQDIRVLLIKLADRLHNMRTIEFIPDEAKRRKIAEETLEIYAPLAHRLGIAWIKWELEDLAFKQVNPEMHAKIQALVAKSREEREAYIEAMRHIVQQKLEEKGIKATIQGRPKNFYSIYKKMEENGLSFEEVYDLTALRVIVDTPDECYTVLGIIHSNWPHVPGRFKDYITLPKPNMYQSLHTTVIGPKGERVEFQIRTWEMHRIAEEGIAAHWGYKEKKNLVKDEETRVIQWVRNVLEWQSETSDHKDFLRNLKVDLFPEKVYVFTPKGEVRSFPKGSTPLDFAYAIHTDVGHRCTGARVNGKLVSLNYQLKTGDQVEIITSSNAHPSRDWLKLVKTSRARTKIQSWLRTQERERAFSLGKSLCQTEFRKLGKNFNRYLEEEKIDAIASDFGFRTAEDLVVAVGFGKVAPRQVARKAISPEEVEGEKEKKRLSSQLFDSLKPQRRLEGTKISVKGIDDVLVRFAKCCNPIPGDEIVGYITRGKGITVHAANCPNLMTLQLEPERQIEVEWETDNMVPMPVKLLVETEDTPGILAEITTAISKQGVNIEDGVLKTDPSRKRGILKFTVDVKNTDQLEAVIHAVRKIEGVIFVNRVLS